MPKRHVSFFLNTIAGTGRNGEKDGGTNLTTREESTDSKCAKSTLSDDIPFRKRKRDRIQLRSNWITVVVRTTIYWQKT